MNCIKFIELIDIDLEIFKITKSDNFFFDV